MRSLIAPLVILTACGPTADKTYDDPALVDNGKAAGNDSAELAGADPSTEQDDMEALSAKVGTSLQGVVNKHYQLTAASRAGLRVDAGLARQADDEGTYSWDGTNLVLKYASSDTAYSYAYDVNLTITDSVIDGTYSLVLDAAAGGAGVNYDITATYEALAFDGDGCATGGSISIVYDFSVSTGNATADALTGAASGQGTVVVAFSACNEVTVTGS